jgi:hypothetical protein
MNRENLATLATYLESLPASYQHFDMTVYFMGNGEVAYGLYNGGVAKCGAVACAVGHGPAAGILAIENEVQKGVVCWNDYCQRVFGIHFKSQEYRFMFYDNWADHDPTPLGAAQRIRYLLAGNAPLKVGDLSYKESSNVA